MLNSQQICHTKKKKKKGEINIDGFNQIVSEIRDFAEFKLSRLCKGGVDCGKHSREKK